jgi:hypothetical protein
MDLIRSVPEELLVDIPHKPTLLSLHNLREFRILEIVIIK